MCTTGSARPGRAAGLSGIGAIGANRPRRSTVAATQSSWLVVRLAAMERAFGLEIPRTLEEVCDPRRLALIVYDMQIGVLRQIRDAETIAKRVVAGLPSPRPERGGVGFFPAP